LLSIFLFVTHEFIRSESLCSLQQLVCNCY